MNAQNYNCLRKNIYVHDSYELVPIRIQDVQLIRKWRNEQIKFLRQEIPITYEVQKSYFENVIKPSFNQSKPKVILFSFMEKSSIIGYGGFVNINWNDKISEISFLIDTERAKNSGKYRNDFTSFLNLLKKIACNDLKFRKLFTETYDIRPIHIAILEKNEFKIKSRQKGAKIIDDFSIKLKRITLGFD